MKLTVVVLLLTGLCLSAPARAQTSEARERARALLAEGAKLFDDGDYEGALGKFEAAHRLVPSPKLYFNIGQAQRSLARDVEALEAFETFVAEAHDAPAERRREAEQAIAALGRRIARLRLRCDLDGASITVDGRAMGVTPRAAPLRLTAGPHQLVVEKSGTPPFLQRLELRAGD